MKQLTPNWEFVSDTVMGGVSSGGVAEEIVGGRNATVLRGKVSLENNGGFIQMAFSSLVSHRVEAIFDPTCLRRIGILAIGRARDACIAVSNIGFYSAN